MAAAAQSFESIEKSAMFGDVIARAASYSPARVAETALALLALRPHDAVLELGCGSGRLLAQVAVRVQRGFAAGIDPSPLMVRHARFRNRRLIERGIVEIEPGGSRDLSRFDDGRFDRVYGMHVVYFWDEPQRDLAEVRRVLRPGGRVVLAFCPEDPTQAAVASDRVQLAPAVAEEWLAEAGFTAIEGRCVWDDGRPLAWLAATRA